MTQKRNLSKRIRNIKSCLENAEQSFLEDRGIRGELDLMLAEAELNNLRRKKDIPWSWNRQVLAVCAAVMLLLSGLGGWYYAQHANSISSSAAGTDYVKPAVPVVRQVTVEEHVVKGTNKTITNEAAEVSEKQNRQLILSDADMRALVKSARTELTSAK